MPAEASKIDTSRLLEKARASFAFHVVTAIRDNEKDGDKAKYASLAQNLPSMILQNGLGQSLAFLMSKAQGKLERPEGKFVEHLAKWFLDEAPDGRKPLLQSVSNEALERLMASLLASNDRRTWARVQHEALALSTWIKRFAEALLPDPEAETGSEMQK